MLDLCYQKWYILVQLLEASRESIQNTTGIQNSLHYLHELSWYKVVKTSSFGTKIATERKRKKCTQRNIRQKMQDAPYAHAFNKDKQKPKDR